MHLRFLAPLLGGLLAGGPASVRAPALPDAVSGLYRMRVAAVTNVLVTIAVR